MKNLNIKMITSIAGCLILLSVFTLNLSSMNSKSLIEGSTGLSQLVSQASAYDESDTGSLKWSGTIQCPGLFDGDYRVCTTNGSGNSCSTEGAKTCNCGPGGNC